MHVAADVDDEEELSRDDFDDSLKKKDELYFPTV